MKDLAQGIPIVLVLGDSTFGIQIAEWIAQYSEAQVHVLVATCFDQSEEPVIKPGVTILGPVGRLESEGLARQYAVAGNFLITCYWPWLLPESVFEGYEGRSLNFHPALLPLDRGWYPHVHQVRDGRSGGVTLHQLATEADSGAIWVQKQVEFGFPITAEDARSKLQGEILGLFKSNWWSIFHGIVQPQDQVGEGTYLSKNDIASFDIISGNDVMSVEEAIRAIACRNSGRKSYVTIQGDTGPLFVHIGFSESGSLDLST